MSDDVVVVTGGASGIGAAVVVRLLEAGAGVAVLDVSDKAEEAHRQNCAAHLERAHFRKVDITDETAVARIVADIENDVGPITGLVNSAGIGREVPALDTSIDVFRRIVDINLAGSFIVSQQVARHMVARGHGAIVNIASVSGMLGNSGRAAYGASKGGLITLTRVMAVELAQSGVRVNAVAPGPVETPMTLEMHSAATREAWANGIPQRRYGTTNEIAAAVVFLLKDSEASYITGQTLAVDGGFSTAGLL
jgi:NAD(P)-dependent dehydrogenase (short-subunit alcohol dehydrogenase family)